MSSISQRVATKDVMAVREWRKTMGRYGRTHKGKLWSVNKEHRIHRGSHERIRGTKNDRERSASRLPCQSVLTVLLDLARFSFLKVKCLMKIEDQLPEDHDTRLSYRGGMITALANSYFHRADSRW